MPLPRPGDTPNAAMLDAPPPSPALADGVNPGQPIGTGTPLGDLVNPGGGVMSDQMPPEVLTGVLQAGEQMVGMIDSFVQVMPDLAPDFALAKDALMRALSKVLAAGGGPTSPNAPGPNFPGGGMESGGFPLASGG